MPGRTLSTAPRGYIHTPDSAPGFWQLGNLWRLMASGHLTGNTLSFLDQLCDGGGPSVHMHPSDEGLYVVSGHCTFHAGGANLSAGPGSLVFVPRFTEHAFSVDASDTHLLNFYLPAGFDMFVMGVAHPAERNELPRKGDVAMPPQRLVEQLSADYGQLAAGGLPVPGVSAPESETMVTRPNPDAVVQPFRATADESRRWWYDGQLWSVLADGARTANVSACSTSWLLAELVRARICSSRPTLSTTYSMGQSTCC
jgi:mannose-6-phosphate isomerase-like protein (cupin superfamily)